MSAPNQTRGEPETYFVEQVETRFAERVSRGEDLEQANAERASNLPNETDAGTAMNTEVDQPHEQAPPEYADPPSYEYVLWSEKLKESQLRSRTPATCNMYKDVIKELGYLIQDPISTEDCFKCIHESVSSIELEELQSADFANPTHLDGWQTWIFLCRPSSTLSGIGFG